MIQLILIAGAGQNVGKTTLACQIIEKLAKNNDVTAIKIAGHHHPITNLQKVIFQSEGITVTEETNWDSNKDSSRFLKAGAKRSIFILTSDHKMGELANWLKLNMTGWVVCESGLIGKYIQPLKAIFVEGTSHEKGSTWEFPFVKTIMHNGAFQPTIEELLIDLRI